MPSYNTSTFSNKEGAADRISQRKALVAKLHQNFDGEPSLVVQFLANISHRCAQTGISGDFDFVISENAVSPSVDNSDPAQTNAWAADPDRYNYGNLLEDSSKATMENIIFMRTVIRSTVKKIRSKPKAGSVEADHLVSFQNRMWFYDLLMSSWTPKLIATMSKYLEHHDGDGVVLLFCFIKHFAGASTENIIDAYQQLTESKVQLALYKNDVSAFTNAVRAPTRQLANANEQPTFQHVLSVYHGLMDCPNEEFRLYVTNLYREYRSGGASSRWTMLELLDELDNEYTRINSLNRWEKGSQGSEILALTAELSKLKSSFAKLQQSKQQQSAPSGTVKKVEPPTAAPKGVPPSMPTNKPAEPPKEGAKQTVTINGVIWKWCQTCYRGDGTWNRTHTTAQHVVGAGKGHATKGKGPGAKSTANLAVQQDNEDAASGGVFLV